MFCCLGFLAGLLKVILLGWLDFLMGFGRGVGGRSLLDFLGGGAGVVVVWFWFFWFYFSICFLTQRRVRHVNSLWGTAAIHPYQLQVDFLRKQSSCQKEKKVACWDWTFESVSTRLCVRKKKLQYVEVWHLNLSPAPAAYSIWGRCHHRSRKS